MEVGAQTARGYLESMLDCSVSCDREAFEKLDKEYPAVVEKEFGSEPRAVSEHFRQRDYIEMSFTAHFIEDRDFFRFMVWSFLYNEKQG